MANDNGPNENSKQDIDLDDIELEILVIAKTPNKLNSMASFLTRRGWPTTVLGSVSQSIEFIAEKKPDFVLISLNHPNPAMAKIPDLIQGTFNLTCIGFVETFDTASQAKLNKSRMRHKIAGQPSGPTLHRSIRKILAEKLNINLDDGKSASSSHDSENKGRDGGESTVTIRGNNKAANGGTIIQKSSADFTRDQGVIIQGGNGPGPSAGGMIQAGGDNSPMSATSGMDSGEVHSAIQNGSEVVSTGKYTMAKANRRSLKDITKSTASEATSATSPERQAEVLASLKKSLLGDRKEGEASAGAPVEGDANFDAVTFFGPEQKRIDENRERYPLERIVENAFASLCKPAEVHTALGAIVRVGVFPVDSPFTPGYLVVATAMAERSRAELFKDAEKALVTAFETSGAPGKLESGFWVAVPEVDFLAWSEKDAKFSLHLNHEGIEISAAFFQSEKALPKISESPGKGMVSLDVDEVSTDIPVNFKAYLHMAKNEKYYLYLRNGRKLQEEQKQRLKENQIANFHMKNVDKENVRMFLAAVFLSDSIKALGNSGEDAA